MWNLNSDDNSLCLAGGRVHILYQTQPINLRAPCCLGTGMIFLLIDDRTRVSKTFAAWQMSEISRSTVHWVVSLPGFGIRMINDAFHSRNMTCLDCEVQEGCVVFNRGDASSIRY